MKVTNSLEKDLLKVTRQIVVFCLFACHVCFGVSPTITSFTGGQLTPQLESRFDFPKYRLSCRIVENMLATVQGPIQRRPGTRYVATAPNSVIIRNHPPAADGIINIFTAEDLQKITYDGNFPRDGDYQLMNDIDCSSIVNWLPLGEDGASAFSGSFDGRYFTISNVTITRTTDSVRIGFFGTVTDAEIKRCIVTNVTITSSVRLRLTGLFIGTITSASPALDVTDCYASGTITQTSSIFNLSSVGGFVGNADLDNGTLLRCGVDVTITSAVKGLRVGGFIGDLGGNPEGVVQDCYATGSILMPSNVLLYGVGGFIGESDYRTGVNQNIFNNCYCAVKITGEQDNSFFTVRSSVGGFSGRMAQTADDNKEFNACFWDNDVGSAVTGIVGDLDDCGNLAGGSGDPADPGNLDTVTKSTTSAMQQEATYIGWDFTDVNNIWQINEGNAYPVHQWRFDDFPSGDNGTVEDNDVIRLISFAVSTDDSYVIEVGNQYMRFYRDQ